MGNGITQFRSIVDGCIYFWDSKLQRFRKICDVSDPAELPPDVKRQIRALREEAGEILQIPAV
jgi:hypothetical protein